MKLSNKAKKNFAEDNEFYIKLGKRLRQARRTKVNEFTGKETIVPLTKVAKALKNTYQQIGKYEKGQNGLNAIRIIQISKILNLPKSYLLENIELLGEVKLPDNNSLKESYENV